MLTVPGVCFTHHRLGCALLYEQSITYGTVITFEYMMRRQTELIAIKDAMESFYGLKLSLLFIISTTMHQVAVGTS